MFWFFRSCPFCEFMLCEPGVEPPDEDEIKSFLSCAPPPLDEEEDVCMPGTTTEPVWPGPGPPPWLPSVVMSSPAADAVLDDTGRWVPVSELGSRQAPVHRVAFFDYPVNGGVLVSTSHPNKALSIIVTIIINA
uniref:Uncharacterized protein n=1 Tax=Anopheles coluzzii TaxID=1518534 RepID=A0A8W7PU24_ANOCL